MDLGSEPIPKSVQANSNTNNRIVVLMILIALFFGITQFAHHQTPVFYTVGTGAGDANQNISQTINIAEPNLKLFGESIAEECEYGCLDTVPGYVKHLGGYIDYPLPLCLTPEEISDWWFSVEVYGGYHPDCGYIEVWQKGVKVGTLYIDWFEFRPEGCCTPGIWNATFHLGEGVECIDLDSNQYPIVDENCKVVSCSRTIPGKEVCFSGLSCWAGCTQESQRFMIISTHALSVFDSIFKFPEIILSESMPACTA